LDIDAAGEPDARYKILSDFNKGEIDILIGTRILFKGIDFKETGLIGLINADSAMHLPDFRAQERTFALLFSIISQSSQDNSEIKIAIQTYLPDHFVIKDACRLNYLEFYKKEIKQRKDLDLPPYYHLNYLILRGKRRDKVIEKTKELYEIIKENRKGKRFLKVVEPQPHNVSKLRDYYRQKIIIKGKDLTLARRVIAKSLDSFKKPSDIIVTLDIDALED
jgi:primosomal protein N' (replication factor Y) (superfamily II helicase)